MKKQLTMIVRLSMLAAAGTLLSNCAHEPVTQANAANASSSQISADSRAALKSLYASNPTARRLGQKASGILVFPHIMKGGFVVGAEGGNGTLFNSGGGVKGYYQTAGASWGLQAGVQKYGYALFLMNSSDVANLDRAAGWEVGSSPSLVVVDKGAAANLTTTTIDKGIYAFVFDQKGLMGGLGLKGTKITRIHPGR
jgi:lipid-binding SYLF domain-containing protein